MNKTAVLFIFTLALLAPQNIKAQGTTYVSNLDLPSSGNKPVGSDSWLAIAFYTGNNPGGYLLNSVQLGMTEADGSPNGFSAMIYDSALGANIPRASLGSLNGFSDPASGGTFTFTADENIMLSPREYYFIVLTSGTPVSTGAFELGLANAHSYDQIDGWYGTVSFFSSVNGLSWSLAQTDPLYAINATAVPEPSVFILIAFGGLPWAWRRFCRGC